MGLWDRLSRTLDELSEGLLPDDVRDGVDGAQMLLERGNPRAAAAALEDVLRRKPDHATALYLLGVARVELGEARKAVAAFSQAIGHRAGFAEAYVGLGEARLLEKDASAAMAAFRDAMNLSGSSAVLAAAYRGLGQAFVLAGDRERGVRELRKSLIEGPGDVGTVTTLAEALLAGGSDGELDQVRGPLESAAADQKAPAAVLVAMARLELSAGRLISAETLVARALSQEAPPAVRTAALMVRADLLVRRRDLAGAHQALLEALALESSAELHLRIAQVHRAARNYDAALTSAEAAEKLGAKDALPLAVDLALEGELGGRAAALASRLLAQNPEHPRGLAARGAALALAGEKDAAKKILEKAVEAGDRRDAPLWLGRLAADPAEAQRRALHILSFEPRERRARDLFVDALGKQLAPPESEPDTPLGLAQRIVALLRHEAGFGPLVPDAVYALESYDRPLLLTVMGEFSSGKSTFVNALLGAEVAPVGVTPTTATINVLKYGREPRARLVYRDDREREVAWADVSATLKALTAGEASAIRVVELLYPLESLERVSIVDTPGLNSILPEHEATARQFIEHADAVVWLMSAQQAGKASEREALEKIQAAGKRVLGVVNKIDQVSEGERGQILAYIEASLPNLCEAFVPVSARRALAARSKADAAALADAGWPALEAALETRFFAQARIIKRDALGKRLAAVLAAARKANEEAMSATEAQVAQLERAMATLRTDAELFVRASLVEESGKLAERLAQAYRRAAREVLDVVRPRKLPFGDNRATVADRDHLLSLLERALAELIEPTRARVHAEIGKSAADAGLEEAPVRDAVALVDARVFDRFRAFARGFLRGGAIDDFFARRLPRLAPLDEDSVYQALVRDAPDLRVELAEPLGVAVQAALRGLADLIDRRAGAGEVARAQEEAMAAAIDELGARLVRLKA